jgi:Xaa-Pro aminopeptidase
MAIPGARKRPSQVIFARHLPPHSTRGDPMSRLSALAVLTAAAALIPPALSAQTGSPAGPIPVERLEARRAALLARVGVGTVVLRSTDERDAETDYLQDNDFRQDNDFFYLTGLETPGSWLVIQAKDSGAPHAILYIPARDTLQERWTGVKLGPGPEVTAISGIEDVRPAAKAEQEIRGLVYGGGRRLLVKFGDGLNKNDFLRSVAIQGPANRVEDLRPLMAALRLTKDDEEIRRMRKAAALSADGHKAAMMAATAGLHEYDLEATVESTFRHEGAERLGYPSIVGTGIDGTTLHYDINRRQLGPNDLVVIDAAGEFGYYTADVTRTFPVSGKFTPHQKAVYELVLATQQAAMDSIHPGQTIGNLNRISREFMRAHSGDLCGAKTCDNYYPHSLSHWLGMDVHDVGNYQTPLAPGMVFTVEPGIYLPAESLGVRIEDDVLVTATGYENLSAGAPRTVADVEKLMAQGAKERKKK